MARKNNQTSKTLLLMPKEEFKVFIEERIVRGKELLKVEVPSRTIGSYFDAAMGAGRIKRQYEEAGLKAFKNQYSEWTDYNIELLKQAFEPAENEYLDSYQSYSQILGWGDGDDAVKRYKDVIENEISKLERLINKLSLIPLSPEVGTPIQQHGRMAGTRSIPTKSAYNDENGVKKDVFIVHGHDGETKQTVARLLEKLGLHPIILHEQPNSGRTIIEKLENAGATAGFAVILLTSDDTGKANRETDYKPRARQNVVFEMGYFMKQIGRNNVMLLLTPGVEKPGDVDGLVYTPLDAAGAWKFELVKELQSSGFKVSADAIL